MKKLVWILMAVCCVSSEELSPTPVRLTPAQRVQLDNIVKQAIRQKTIVSVLEYGQPFVLDMRKFKERISELESAKVITNGCALNATNDPGSVVLRTEAFSKDDPYVWAYDTVSFVLKKIDTPDGKSTYEKQVSGWEMHFDGRWIPSFFVPYDAEHISDFEIIVNKDDRYHFRYKMLFRSLGDDVYIMMKARPRS